MCINNYVSGSRPSICRLQTKDLEIGRRVQLVAPFSLVVTGILTADYTADTIDKYDKYKVFIIARLLNDK